jgi:hypothetical protein
VPVTDDDVAHVRAAYEDFRARHERFTQDDLTAYFHRFYADDAVIENVESFPLPARYEGLDGYLRWFDESYSPYEDIAWDIIAVEAIGERVVARTRVSGRPRGEEVRLEVRLGITYEMRGGRIGHVRVYLSHDRALEAASVTTATNAE